MLALSFLALLLTQSPAGARLRLEWQAPVECPAATGIEATLEETVLTSKPLTHPVATPLSNTKQFERRHSSVMNAAKLVDDVKCVGTGLRNIVRFEGAEAP